MADRKVTRSRNKSTLFPPDPNEPGGRIAPRCPRNRGKDLQVGGHQYQSQLKKVLTEMRG